VAAILVDFELLFEKPNGRSKSPIVIPDRVKRGTARMAAQRWIALVTIVICTEKSAHASHKRVHRPAATVTSDIGVQVEPNALDAIVIRAVRRQKMEHDLAVELLDATAGNLTGVNDVVVEDDVDAMSAAMLSDKTP
jgi:hypothetical protein